MDRPGDDVKLAHVSIRLFEDDLELAKKQARDLLVPWQTHLRKVIREGLRRKGVVR
jgi:predicted DNA binding CopG/RHH family protein